MKRAVSIYYMCHCYVLFFVFLSKVNNEITSGSVTNYKIVVKTGNKLGASTRAQVKIVLYGDRGRSKPIDLLESKTNKIQFQKGKVNIFFFISKLI